MSSIIYWDSYGLYNANSGIGVHGRSLWNALVEKPNLVTPSVDETSWIPFKTIRHATLSQKKIPQDHMKFIFHGLSNVNLPLFSRKGARYVVTVHDIIPLLFPTHFDFGTILHMKIGLSNVRLKAEAVICVSEWSRHALLSLHPDLESRVYVIPNGYDHFPVLPSERKNSGKKNILAVSRYERYKRFEVFAGVAARTKDFQLTLVTDAKGEVWAKKNIDLSQHRVLTHLSREDLAQLYGEADLFLHPSLAEGFCLPAVEAALFGLPILHGTGSGIDEALEPFTLKQGLPPFESVERWVEVCRDWNPERKAATIKSLRSWSDVAKETASLYQKLLG